MEPYVNSSSLENLQALDFTQNSKSPRFHHTDVKHEVDLANEQPVLDLSCKKVRNCEETSNIVSSNDSNHSNSRSNSPVALEKQHQHQHHHPHPHHDEHLHESPNHYLDAERKSPFEGRTFMVTPPSETDSPKKIKYEAIYNRNDTNLNHCSFPILPLTAIVPGTIPTLVNPATGIPNLLPAGGNGKLEIPLSVSPGINGNSGTFVQEIGQSGQPENGKKAAPRPFKAYPKDPLSLTVGSAEFMFDQNSNEAYSEFRKKMLESVRRTNEGTNIKMRRSTKSPGLPTSTSANTPSSGDEKDAAYWERRRKNNEAAKRSRDARRAKEDEIAIRAAFLEQENMKLRYEVVALRSETAKLRCMVYSN